MYRKKRQFMIKYYLEVMLVKLKSIKIANYKSFGENNNILILDDLNTIIGKNESGKSNLIECLSKIELTGISDKDYFLCFNKNTNLYPEIGLVLIPYTYEKQKYHIEGETKITLIDRYDISISGGISEMIEKNKTFQKNREKLNELKQIINTNIFGEQTQRDYFQKIITMIMDAEKKIFINYTYVSNIIDRISNYDDYGEFLKYFKECIFYLNQIKDLFPTFIEVNDISLKSKYTTTHLRDTKESKEMLKHFLKCIDINFDGLMGYWSLKSHDDKINYEEEINEKIELLIEGFNRFYSQEEIQMKASFENDSLNFAIRTTKKYMNFDERSNGLKWYLNMYIQILSKVGKNNIENYIVLIDEPGVYLHVNAQKKILELFEDLCLKGNQIVYTTHSPFMIYENKLHRTKLIIKDQDGNSNIGNKYYSLPHKMGSKTETMTPLLTAIGMNMNYNILSLNSNKDNIITEGISDYNFIKGYYILKKTKDIPNIIPSTSVDNIHNIVSILIGWGCTFKIILDQDGSGRGQYKVLTNNSLTDISNISFVDGTNKPNTKLKITIEDIFSKSDKINIGINNDDYNNEKAYYSLETLKKIENGEFQYDNETMSKFDKIIDQLFK